MIARSLKPSLFCSALLCAWAALLLAACKPAAPRSEPAHKVTATSAAQPLRVAGYYWPGQFWVDIAHRKGWFKEEGLNAEWVDTNPNYFGSFDDLVAGKLDVVCFVFFDFVAYTAKGHDLVGVIVSDYSSGADALVARPEFERIADLKGRRIALSKGTYLAYLLAVAAQNEGLRLQDFTLVNVPGEQAPQELKAGRADAALTWAPYWREALEAVQGRKLFDTSQLPGVLGCCFVFRRQFIRDRPDDVRRFVRAWRRTTEYIQKQPGEAFRVIAEMYRKTPAEVEDFARLDKILNLSENLRAVSFTSGFDSVHGSLRRINDFMLEHGLTTNSLETTRLVDPRFLKELP